MKIITVFVRSVGVFLLHIVMGLAVLATVIGQAFAADRQIRVAVLDTGIDVADSRFSSLVCDDHTPWDFERDRPMRNDVHGHGTHIAGLIKQHAGNADYCFLFYKVFADDINRTNLLWGAAAMRRAADEGADLVNISSGGPGYSQEEFDIIRENRQVVFVSAAGNLGENIMNPKTEYYPASYRLPNVIAVGSLDPYGNRFYRSNWGSKVRVWEMGVGLRSTLPGGRWGRQTGTSQATAVHTGKLVRARANRR